LLVLIFARFRLACEKEQKLENKKQDDFSSVEHNESDHDHEPNPEQNRPNVDWSQQDVERCQKDLKLLALGLIELSQDDRFRNTLNNKVSEKFDKDYNVLFRDLKEACQSKEYNLINKMKNSIKNHGDLKYIEDTNRLEQITTKISVANTHFYPQVFIPQYTKAPLNETPDIAYIDTTYSEKNEEMNAFQLNKNSDTISSFNELRITSPNPGNNLIWAVTINETVNHKGELPGPPKTNHGGNNCSHNTNKWLEIYDEIKIDENHDWWGAGKNDVKLSFEEYSYSSPNACEVDDQSERIDLDKIKKDDVGNTLCCYHNEFLNTWDQCHKKVAVVIYEYDFKFGLNYIYYKYAYNGCGDFPNISYQSNDNGYWLKKVTDWGTWKATGSWQGTNKKFNGFEFRGRPQ